MDALAQLVGHTALIGEDLAHIVGNIPGVNAHPRALRRVTVYLGGVEQRLGGDAAPIQAGAAHLPALHDGGVQTQLGRPQRCRITAGAGTDDDELIVRHTVSS